MNANNRNVGRPEVGGAVHVRLGGLVEQIDVVAAGADVTRAAAIRQLIEDGLAERARRNEAADARLVLLAMTTADGVTTVEDVQARTGFAAERVESLLSGLAADGLVLVAGGEWMQTDAGYDTVVAHLSHGVEGDAPAVATLTGITGVLLAALDRRGVTLADALLEQDAPAHQEASAPAATTVVDRVIAAHAALADDAYAWVGLRRLRDHLADVPRVDLDAELKSMFRSGVIRLIGEVNQKTLTDEDRAAALHVVGDEKHLFQPAV